MSELLEDWIRFHAGGQYRRHEHSFDRYEKAIEFADTLLKESAITVPIADPVRPEEYILLEIRSLDLPPVAFLFRVDSIHEDGIRLVWLPRRNTDKPILLAFRAGAQAAVRHGLTGQAQTGPSPEWVAAVLHRHAQRNRMNPFEALDLHWTAVGDEPQEAYHRLHPLYSSGTEFTAADLVLQAKAQAVAKKIQEAYEALDTPEKRSRQRMRWGDLHQLGSATIVLTQRLAAARRTGDTQAEARLQTALEELERTGALFASEKLAGKKKTDSS
ncbi:MAG: hypothetical protein JW797_06210 [Bradymonadales bacterium]|nr:hypothetical protein [Bradymonadales bacterium]